jgi:hypothetical protein
MARIGRRARLTLEQGTGRQQGTEGKVMSSRKGMSSLGAGLLLCAAGGGFQLPAQAATWYVAPGGSGNGSQAQPFGKIQDAANAAQAGDLISVSPGTYHETVTVNRSGTATAPIVFQSQQTGAAVVSGADPVGTLSAGGTGGSWSSGAVPGFASSIGQDEQCFAGRTRLPVARWPATPAAALSSPAFALVKSVANLTQKGYIATSQMYVMQADVGLDRALPAGSWVGALAQMNVGLSYDQVSGSVTQQGTAADGSTVLTLVYYTPSHDQLAAGNELYLSGVSAALASGPGQWLRNGSGLLLRAPGDADPNTLDIECKQRDFAFDLSGASYITIQGFGIFAAAITTEDNSGDPAEGPASWTLHTGQGSVAAASHIVLDTLTVDTPNSIRNLFGNVSAQWTNNSGVVLSGSYNTLQNSTILRADGNGVSLAGVGNKVLNNHIYESNLAGCECAGISTGFRGVNSLLNILPGAWAWTWNMGEEIGNNVIERSGRALINISALGSASGTPSRVHHNLLSGAVLQTYDNGAIYSTAFPNETAQVPQAGLEIDHNIITASPVGIYLDVYSKGFLIHHNIITGPGEPYLDDSALIVNSASNHQIYNNTLMPENAASATIRDWQPALGDSGVTASNNILYPAAPILGCLPGCEAHDLVWNGTAGSAADPHFNNARVADYSLASGSAAIDAGVAIAGVTDDSRSGSQAAVGRPDQGAIEYGTASWVPSAAGDSTAPTITLSTPADGASYQLKQTVKAYYSCSDNGGSGVARCTGTARNRALVDTGSAGSKAFTVTAVDRAGNSVTRVVRYSVAADNALGGSSSSGGSASSSSSSGGSSSSSSGSSAGSASSTGGSSPGGSGGAVELDALLFGALASLWRTRSKPRPPQLAGA